MTGFEGFEGFIRMKAETIFQRGVSRAGIGLDAGDEWSHIGGDLGSLVNSLNDQASLSMIGKIMVKTDLERMLVNYLQVKNYLGQMPDEAGGRVEKPVFIVGMPRTGSSFLHNLMASDPGWRAPKYWETLYSSPPAPSGAPDLKRIGKAKRDLGMFHLMAPRYRSIYMYGAELAAECIAVMAMAFSSPRFGFTYRVPEYWESLLKSRCRRGYHFHRQFLTFLQSGEPGCRWLLKAPAHIMFLDALLETYPDSRLIFTHRHPMAAMPSIASNTYTLRKVFSGKENPEQVGSEELDRWSRGWSTASKVRQSPALPPDNRVDVQYDQLMKNPILTVQNIYRQFGMDFTENARHSMQAFLNANQKNKHGKHHYQASTFGINHEQVDAQFADYISEFNLKP